MSKGVLDKRYAIERLQKPELIFRYKTRARFVSNTIKEYLNRTSGLAVLDFGAAEGLTLAELDNLIPKSEFTGIEYSSELIDTAPELPKNVALVQGDVMNLSADIKEKKYDAVCALALLEHLPDPLKSIQQAADVLKPGGLFIATSPNPFWDDISTRLGLLREDQHETDMDKKLMKKIVEEAGLEILRFQRFMWTPVSFLPYMHIKVNAGFSLSVDRLVEKVVIFNWMFVNQAIIARKPLDKIGKK